MRPSAAAAAPAKYPLFVTLPEQRSVAVFAADANGNAPPLATIKEFAPDTPIDAGVNLRGEIFVGNSNGTVNVYAGENRVYQLVRTLAGPNTKMVHPMSMAVDMSGTSISPTAVERRGSSAWLCWPPRRAAMSCRAASSAVRIPD